MYYDNENFYPGRARDARTEKMVRAEGRIGLGLGMTVRWK